MQFDGMIRYDAGKFRDGTLCQGVSLLDRAIVNAGLSRRSAQAIVIERSGDVVEIQFGKLVTERLALSGV